MERSDPRTTPAVLDRMARELGDHGALITEERTFTFAQLRDEVRRTAAAMIGLGVQAGDRVAIWSPNTWHWVVASLATHYAGAVVVPLNTRYTAGEAADILARTQAPLLIAMGRFLGADRVAELDRAALPDLEHIVRVPIEAADGSWDDFVSGPQAPMSEVDARAAALSGDDVSDILFTSGTTGRSKGVLCAHRRGHIRQEPLSKLRSHQSCGLRLPQQQRQRAQIFAPFARPLAQRDRLSEPPRSREHQQQECDRYYRQAEPCRSVQK